jgi:hypothetical protein
MGSFYTNEEVLQLAALRSTGPVSLPADDLKRICASLRPNHRPIWLLMRASAAQAQGHAVIEGSEIDVLVEEMLGMAPPAKSRTVP